VADRGKINRLGDFEHIENAGVHSGDATLVLPPRSFYWRRCGAIKLIARRLAEALGISGPFNIQFLARDNHIKGDRMNLAAPSRRASRSFPR